MIFYLDNISFMQRNFELSLTDVKVLVDLYNTIIAEKNIQKNAKYESLKRSAILLLITSWENYIEDTLKMSFETYIDKVKSPQDIKATFNEIANLWLDGYKERKPKPPDLILWTGNKWKNILLERLKNDINNFNTPNSQNIDRLFKRYFNKSIDSLFVIKNQSIKSIKRRLDKLIRIRSEIAHQAKKEIIKTGPDIKISFKYVNDSIILIENLVHATENNFVSMISNFTPNQQINRTP